MALLNKLDLDVDQLLGQTDTAGTLPKLFGGMDAYDAKQQLQQLIDYGQMHKCHYVVAMTPYLADGVFKNTAMSELLGNTLDDDKAIWCLVTQTNLPIMQTDTDSVKAGAFQVNRITGLQSTEIQMTFLESGEGLITKALQTARDAKFVGNGLQRPPAQTAIRLRIGMFTRSGGRTDIQIKEEYLVEVQGVDPLSLAGNDGSPAEVVVTFGQLDPFMG